MKSLKAFTLAEVLITLVVIGIISSLTIPNLLQDIQDDHLRTQWKKVFSEMTVATNKIIADNGDFSNINDHYSIKNDYKRYLSFVYENASSVLFLPTSSYRCYKGATPEWAYPVGYPSAILADGSVIVFFSQQNNCTRSNGIQNICGYFVVDVNSKNSPNMWGKDLFDAWIVKDPNKGYKIIPIGTPDDNYTCTPGGTQSQFSQGCSAISLLNGPMP